MRLIRFWPVLAGMLVGSCCSNAFAQEPAGTVTLTWTAPGDDDLIGTATRYDIRYSFFPINENNFAYCSSPPNVPTPSGAGSPQSCTVRDLFPGLRYYFAMKTADERLNWSTMSNVVAFADPVVGVVAGLAPIDFSSPVPNPARSSAAFSYSLVVHSRIQVDIFDVQGRLVHRLADTDRPPGTGLLTWDLRDKFGQRVGVGIYLARARLGEKIFTRRVLVAR